MSKNAPAGSSSSVASGSSGSNYRPSTAKFALPQSAMAAASVIVTSGLRPKKMTKPVSGAGAFSNRSSTLSLPQRSVYTDPTVRLFDLILPWRALDDDGDFEAKEAVMVSGKGLVEDDTFSYYSGSSSSSSSDNRSSVIGSREGNNRLEQVEGIPTVFQSFAEYLNAWEPLWIMELKAKILSNLPQLSSSRLQNPTSFRWKYSDGADLDSAVVSIDILMADADLTNMDAVLISTVPIKSILSQVKNSSNNSNSSNSNSKTDEQRNKRLVPSYCFGVVNSFNRNTGGRIKVSTAIFAELTSSADFSALPSKSNASGRRSQQDLYFATITNIRSDWREFYALYELGNGHIPLFSEILCNSCSIKMPSTPGAGSPSSPPYGGMPPPPPSSHHGGDNNAAIVDKMVDKWSIRGVSSRFMQHLKSKFNASQINAIRSAVDQLGFTIIQGPPGSGKTTTILALLNAIHIREYDMYYKLTIDSILGPEGQACRTAHMQNNTKPWLSLISRLSHRKPRILVTAPSNVAVDNIIERLLRDGFVDGSGNGYKPNILRVGSGSSSRVNAVCLDDTIEQERLSMHDSQTKRVILDGLMAHMNALLTEMYQIQTLLINLKIAFDIHQLPNGWELRISADTAQPYWVDHINQCNSSKPPPPPAAMLALGKPSGLLPVSSTVDSVAEFRIFSHKLTQLFEAIDILNLKCVRIQAALRGEDDDGNKERSRYYSVGGGSSSSSSHLGGNGRNSYGGDNSTIRQQIESSVIEGAQILFATLNSTGHASLAHTEYCVAVVDEAAQCVEPSLLIALQRGVKQCVLVGDQKQLPATIFSPQVRPLRYDRSLFERLIDAGHPCQFLDTQYRMHPQISHFPSKMFYDSKLRDGKNVGLPNFLPKFLAVRSQGSQPERSIARITSAGTNSSSSSSSKLPVGPTPIFTPFLFFDLRNSVESLTGSMSRINRDEVTFCLNLLHALQSEATRLGCTLGSVGIITPYSEQAKEIRRALENESSLSNKGIAEEENDNSFSDFASGSYKRAKVYAPSTLPSKYSSSSSSLASLIHDIEISTVDGFQGKEKDVIIISTVRSNEQGGVGFVSDQRRMNVAITRAKYALYVVGNKYTLQYDPMWYQLLQHAANTDALLHFNSLEEDILEAVWAGGRENTNTTTTHNNNNNNGNGNSCTRGGSAEDKNSDVRSASDKYGIGYVYDPQVDGGLSEFIPAPSQAHCTPAGDAVRSIPPAGAVTVGGGGSSSLDFPKSPPEDGQVSDQDEEEEEQQQQQQQDH